MKQTLQDQRHARILSKTNQLKKTGELKTITPKSRTRAKDGVPKKTWISGLEKYTKSVAEEAFGVSFQKTRGLPWLVNPFTKKRLEIDLYNDDLKLGLEVDGRMHRMFVPHFHADRSVYEAGLQRDLIKRNLCQANGVVLLHVPHFIKREELKPHLLAEYAKAKKDILSRTP